MTSQTREAAPLGKRYEVRCPVHGFIVLDDWERDIIGHPVYQRLRQIRQLGWTDMLYPGAMHTRFEHSLGVMHTATRMFEDIWGRRKNLLEALNFSPGGRERDRTLIRLAALLHDVGHSPFSHAGEDLMPHIAGKKGGKRYKHEHYSGEIVRTFMQEVIDHHPRNQNFEVKASEIADIIEGKPAIGQRKLLWRQLISSQLDADRADYLLRDSHHIGVRYGRYDLERLVVSLTIAQDENGNPVLAVDEGGLHAAEALILARYMMFTQVYFHRVRGAYDHHIAQAMKVLLSEDQKADDDIEDKSAFPPPMSEQNLEKYLAWNDWRALGLLQAGNGGVHGEILRKRAHHRLVYETPEVPKEFDLKRLRMINDLLGDRVAFVGKAESSWYKAETNEIMIAREGAMADTKLTPLSELSHVVRGLLPSSQRRLYVALEKRNESREIVKKFLAA